MTKQEKIIVSAYTGVLMCDFDDVHKYIQEKLDRLVFTHELADKGIQKEVKEKSKKDFLEICSQEETERKKGKWIYPTDIIGFCRCGNCNALWDKSLYDNQFFQHCPRCGEEMEK